MAVLFVSHASRDDATVDGLEAWLRAGYALDSTSHFLNGTISSEDSEVVIAADQRPAFLAYVRRWKMRACRWETTASFGRQILRDPTPLMAPPSIVASSSGKRSLSLIQGRVASSKWLIESRRKRVLAHPFQAKLDSRSGNMPARGSSRSLSRQNPFRPFYGFAGSSR
jgi:hypothetical protein